MFRRAALLLAGLLSASATGVVAQNSANSAPPAENLTLAHQVLTEMGAARQFAAGVESALPAQRRAQPGIPTIFWDSLVAEMQQRAPEIIDSLAVTYAKVFTTSQLKELLTFYQSPAGRRLAEVQSELTATMGAIGQRWGIRIAADVMKRLSDQGVSFDSP
jgi:hypothetical protein